MRRCATPECSNRTSHPSRLCAICHRRREAQFAAEDALGDVMARQGRSTTACDDQWAEDRVDAIGQNGNEGLHYPKQPRYQDLLGEDWIDEFARTATADEFRGARRFTIGKYNRRVGKKDSVLSEVRKMRDYCQRWEAYEAALEGEA